MAPERGADGVAAVRGEEGPDAGRAQVALAEAPPVPRVDLLGRYYHMKIATRCQPIAVISKGVYQNVSRFGNEYSTLVKAAMPGADVRLVAALIWQTRRRGPLRRSPRRTTA